VKSTKTMLTGACFWCTAVLRDRADRADRLETTTDDRAGRTVFPASFGAWRDPFNTPADLGDAFTACGSPEIVEGSFMPRLG
jgi:hypothetical protein